MPSYNKLCHPSPAFIYGSATSYNYEPVKQLIWQLKFQGQKLAAKPLSEIVSNYWFRESIDLSRFHAIIPVPLHPRRERKRGYNQCELIAKELLSSQRRLGSSEYGFQIKSGMTTNDDIITRTKETDIQTNKNMEERRKNLENAFSVNKVSEISGKNFIVLDDVLTSGATLGSVIKTLKENGAKKVIGLAIAKA